MLARTPLRDLAIGWLEGQDPAGRYDWDDPVNCGCGQLARALRRSPEWIKALTTLQGGQFRGEWHELNVILRGDWNKPVDWTFGGFLGRLRAAA
jgi:hypothetical protein